MERLEVGQYVKVTLPRELKTTGKYGAPYYSGIGEVIDSRVWNDGKTRYCIYFSGKGYVWFMRNVIKPGKYAGMTHTIKHQLARVSS